MASNQKCIGMSQTRNLSFSPPTSCQHQTSSLPVLFFFFAIWDMLSTSWSVPGFQWYVAVQDPAIVEMHWILSTGWGSRGSRTGLAAGGHWPPLERISCWRWFSGTGACMWWWRRRWEGSEGELVMWATWHIWNNKEKAKKPREGYYSRSIKRTQAWESSYWDESTALHHVVNPAACKMLLQHVN